jgi:hypothetical protein
MVDAADDPADAPYEVSCQQLAALPAFRPGKPSRTTTCAHHATLPAQASAPSTQAVCLEPVELPSPL